MNPLDWSGPAFLLFYAALATAALIVVWQLRNRAEDAMRAGALNLSDPYEIAFLRGGAPEAGRIAIVSLIERGAMQVAGKNNNEVVRTPDAWRLAQNPIEKAVMDAFTVEMATGKGVVQAGVTAAANVYQEPLEQRGLLPGEEIRAERSRRVWLAIALLGGLALLKLAVALERGRDNVAFLILLAIIALSALLIQTYALMRRTRAGDRAVADAKRLMEGMRVQATLSPAELTLLAAIFGIGALPATATPYAQQIFPKAGDGGGGGCGSSCGGSCGGGCGGGCGGCGGD